MKQLNNLFKETGLSPRNIFNIDDLHSILRSATTEEFDFKIEIAVEAFWRQAKALVFKGWRKHYPNIEHIDLNVLDSLDLLVWPVLIEQISSSRNDLVCHIHFSDTVEGLTLDESLLNHITIIDPNSADFLKQQELGIRIDHELSTVITKIIIEKVQQFVDQSNFIPKLKDALVLEIEALWEELGDIPFEENKNFELILTEPWLHFESGTKQEHIWRWFDNAHPEGLYSLMYEEQ
ncbi:hypothetical protein bcgnr5390_10780 [Bacillus luti]|nr:hypothetical protein BC2903_30120 [Bacillus cereus]